MYSESNSVTVMLFFKPMLLKKNKWNKRYYSPYRTNLNYFKLWKKCHILNKVHGNMVITKHAALPPIFYIFLIPSCKA